MQRSNYWLFAIACLTLGCSVSLDDYRGSEPELDLREYFDGYSVARGIVKDYSGKITRTFCVDIDSQWTGNTGTLHEQFYFNDGERQTRIWTLNVDNDGSVSGTAADVIGEAKGRIEGAALNWQYTLKVPVGDSEYEFSIDDWIVQTDPDRLVNIGYMKKFGITLAEIYLYFDRSKNATPCT